MKNTIMVFAILLFSLLPLRTAAGPYLGTTKAENGNKLTQENERLKGNQLFAGYKWSKKAGVEMGYSLYSKKEQMDLDKLLNPDDEAVALTFTYNFD